MSPRQTHFFLGIFFKEGALQIGTVLVPLPESAFYPAVGLRSEGEEVRFLADLTWESHDDVSMVIDSVEEEWARLIDIRLNGQVFLKP